MEEENDYERSSRELFGDSDGRRVSRRVKHHIM